MATPTPIQTLNLSITGMSCDHCVRRLSKALTSVPGVIVKNVTVGHANVEYDGRPESLAAIVHAVDDAGYQAQPEAA
jgi:copper chaperone CopZ